jgi:hypothetical protein
LKLVFNVAKIYPDLASTFSTSIPYIFKIISRIEIPLKPLDGLLGGLLNCLSTLDLENKNGKPFDGSPLFPTFNQNCNVDKLINILDQATSAYDPLELETKSIPLLHSLVVIHELAPDGPRKYMQWLLLPDDNDRNQPIGQSDTLSSKLLKLSTMPYANLKVAISELMFVLSGSNVENLTRNIGYGFAAGLLASRGIDIPKSAGEAFSTNSEGLDPDINPITGQRWAAEKPETGPPMTKEEQEREAERLFVLFERYVLTDPHVAALTSEIGPRRTVFSASKIRSPRHCARGDLKNYPTLIASRYCWWNEGHFAWSPLEIFNKGHILIQVLDTCF